MARVQGGGAHLLERMTGIEPALSAWEAEVLPLNYIRASRPPKPHWNRASLSRLAPIGWQRASLGS